MASNRSFSVKNMPFLVLEKYFYFLAKTYLKLKKPTLVVVAGSIGKTSTKMTLGQVLSSCRSVSYMDESYNSGLGLPLSVFRLKTPKKTNSPLGWLKNISKAKLAFFKKGPDFMVLEYGIDSPGEMDAFTAFARPDHALLTAITPEHMEFLKDIDTVAKEETKVLRAAKSTSVVSADYINPKYLGGIENLQHYGQATTNDASYKLEQLDTSGSRVTYSLKKTALKTVELPIVADHLINHTAGVVAMCSILGLSNQEIQSALASVQPTPGRTNLLKGVNNSTILDDTVNFNPEAGIAALELLHKIDAKRKIAVLGNMHELGDYNEQGFADVAKAFGPLDILVLVGELSHKYFGKYAVEQGFELHKDLFMFDTSIEAGEFMASKLEKGDLALVKGPFGGLYMEECVKLLLADKKDAKMLVRQNDYWPNTKRKIFGQDIHFY